MQSARIALITTLLISPSLVALTDTCTLTQGASKTSVKGLLGPPDWLQPENQDAWAYFNAGIECLFKNDRLFAVRYLQTAPFFPARLTTSRLIPGTSGRPVTGLGPIIDRSEKRWHTEIYSDQQSFAVAANYSTLTQKLDNVLLQEASFAVYCSHSRTTPDRALYKKWFAIGSTVEECLRAQVGRKSSALIALQERLARLLGEQGISAASLPSSSFTCCASEPAIPAAALRDFLLAQAASDGRRVGNATPILGMFDGMYLSLARSAPLLKSNAEAMGGFGEMVNHFEGVQSEVYPFSSQDVARLRSSLLTALRNRDANQIKARALEFSAYLTNRP